MKTAAIYFHPEAYSTTGPKLMGRNAAGEGFLRGFLKHSQASSIGALLARAEHGKAFAEAMAASGRSEKPQLFTKAALHRLADFGCVFYPAPGLGEHAWHRTAFGDAAWSLCGITHTICSAGAMDGLVSLLTSPVQPWDAVICTSTAAKGAVTRMLQAQADFLAARVGAQKLVLPQLPIIPLGIHSDDFIFPAKQRHAARAALGADDNTHIVLFAGRLSFHAKAHPLAMYQALEAAAAALPSTDKLQLVQFGQYPNEHIEKAFGAASQLAAPSVIITTLDGKYVENREIAWAAADIFCSLSDNLQETFGLTPLEAMAAGLPCIVSDWDGYKDTVRDGVEGIRIPTLMPAINLGADLALRHALEIDNYDMYCGKTSSFIAPDVEATGRALVALLTKPGLRHRMGQAGRERARQVYDWAAIIPQYESLWAELAEVRRLEGAKLKPLAHPWPARMDPFHAFAGYATQHLSPDMYFELVDIDTSAAIERMRAYLNLAMVDFAKAVLPSEAEIEILLRTVAGGPINASGMLQRIPAARQIFVFRALSWMVKMGLLRICEPSIAR